MKTAFALAILSALQLATPALAGEAPVPDKKTILFVCLIATASFANFGIEEH